MNDHDEIQATRADRRRRLGAGGVLASAAALWSGAPALSAPTPSFGEQAARSQTMPTWRPDPTFYPSPRSAMAAPAETLAYVVRVNPTGDERPDAIVVIDVDPTSERFGAVVGEVEMPHPGDELHHFGWNACSSMLCPNAPHPHVERRYLIAPALGSSRVYVIDTKPDPTQPRIVKTIAAEEVAEKAGYANGHTVHCGPDGIYVSALGAPDGDGPGGIFVLDHDTFDVLGRWEIDRGAQYLHYDFWWHLGYDTMVTSEWGTPNMVQTGVQPELLLEAQYGHQLHFWDLRSRRLAQSLDLGKEHQITLELRPAHDPTRAYGFVNSVVNLNDLSSSIFLWHRKAGANGAADGWDVRKVITIPAEPAEEDHLPPALKPFGAVPPLVTDIELSVDDQMLYVSCWGTGELKQFDVSDPFAPQETAAVRIGGIVGQAPHPASAAPLSGGPQMVEVSRDGRRVYVTNSLYLPWDAQFYPAGIQGWLTKLDADPAGGMAFDPTFFVDFGDQRPHQVRLQGGDASTDSYCFPEAGNTQDSRSRRAALWPLAPGRPWAMRSMRRIPMPQFDPGAAWPWLTLAALGAFHGLNPGMGWLFAVALGLQERRLGAVAAALGPIALGHALAIGTAAVAVGVLGVVLPAPALLVLGGAALLSFAAYKVATRFRHPRWIGMRVTSRQLVLWSFVMATAHGAGLMLAPVLVSLRGAGVPSALAAGGHGEHLGHAGHLATTATDALLPAVAAVGIHSAAMLAVAGMVALIVYQKLGVEVLRRAWINLDLLWVGALAITGGIAIALGLAPLLAG